MPAARTSGESMATSAHTSRGVSPRLHAPRRDEQHHRLSSTLKTLNRAARMSDHPTEPRTTAGERLGCTLARDRCSRAGLLIATAMTIQNM